MFKSYLKVALRNILRHKGSSLLNIVGLAIGIACSVLIFLFVRFELSYDTFHKRADRIYRVAVRASVGDTKIAQTYSSAITFQKLLEEYPEIETGVKFLKLGRVPVTLDDKTFYESKFYAVDSTFYAVFNIPLIHGDPATVLTEPNTVVITENTALKYFGRTDVVGRILEANHGDDIGTIDSKISGVSENVPPNSHFQYDMLASLTTFPTYINDTGWSSNNFLSYIVLREGTSKAGLEEKLKEFTRKYMGGERFDAWVAKGNYWEYYLQPVTAIHLNSDLNGEFEANGNQTYVTMFFIISIIVLLIACINFMNLSTAKSSLRAKEVGIRKTVGSDKTKLRWQFLTESVLLSLMALAVAILIVELLLPSYRNLIGRQIETQYFGNLVVIPCLIVLGVIVGLVSGSYPAFILSSFKPITMLQGRTSEGKSGAWIRNGLFVLQFSISIFLMIGTLTVYQQLDLFQSTRLGFEKERVLVVKNPGTLGSNVNTFKEVLRNQSDIADVSGSNTLPGRSFSNIGFGAEGVENFTLNLCVCDTDFLKTLKLEVAQGRFFSDDFETDSSAVILNEKAVELLGWDDPIGKKVNNWASSRGDFTVVGVIKDYHYESLHQKVRPMALLLSGGYYKNTERYISIRLNTENLAGAIEEVEKTWNRFAPNMPFEYSFLNEDYSNLYANEMQTRKLFTIFSFLAIFIACLGLFGLSSFVADRKIKEIGIRKVLGASVAGITGRLSLNFTKWVILSNLIAWPIAWYAMNRWLQNFAYRIDIGLWMFVLAGVLAIVIALLTVSYQSLKAAMANPVAALKYE